MGCIGLKLGDLVFVCHKGEKRVGGGQHCGLGGGS